MKRTVIVLATMAALSASALSTAAASPVLGERATTVSGWLSMYIADFLRAHASGTVDLQVIGTGEGERLGGDADDYANGKDDKLGPDTDDKRTTGLTGPGGFPVGGGARIQSFLR